MSEKTEPALSAEEWAELGPEPKLTCNWDESIAAFPGDSHDRAHGMDVHDDRHAIAAIALYGQPFGFSREDVTRLRNILENDETRGEEAEYLNWLRSLCDRIESLLPPEK